MRLATLVLVSILAAACTADGSLTPQEAEEIFESARACSSGDACIVVDTYCCPRAINASMAAVVEDANERVEDTEGVCLADCVSADELDASCVDGLCTLQQTGTFAEAPQEPR